jgi:thymidylate kinase
MQPMMMKRIVVFEGLDGTGKTCMARLLSGRYAGLYLATPGTEFDEIRDRLHRGKGIASMLMYLTACAHVYERFEASTHSYLFVDRFWFSSVAHHAWNTNASDHEIADLIQTVAKLLPFPMLTVALSSNRATRGARLSRRSEGGYGPTSESYERTWYRTLGCMRRQLPTGAHVLETDSSDCDEERIAAEVSAVLGSSSLDPRGTSDHSVVANME